MNKVETEQTESFLHRLDPRLKVPVCLGLVILAFAARSWFALALVILGTLFLIVQSRTPAGSLWSTWWSLRWLLLFTLLMHLVLSPGRMLFGSRWLSLDGLLLGAFTCTQLTVAVLCAMLLSVTTPAERLAAAIAWFLAPLKHLGCPVDDWHRQVLLVFKFLPIVREEYLATRVVDQGKRHGSLTQSLQRWVERLKSLLDALIERADKLSRALVSGEQEWALPAAWPPLQPLAGQNGRVVLSGLFFLIVYFVMNGA